MHAVNENLPSSKQTRISEAFLYRLFSSKQYSTKNIKNLLGICICSVIHKKSYVNKHEIFLSLQMVTYPENLNLVYDQIKSCAKNKKFMSNDYTFIQSYHKDLRRKEFVNTVRIG